MLNSLEIKNFRLLENFQVKKLGRVNLIVGKNNSGKSTILEALRIFAGNAQHELLQEIAVGHDEKFRLKKGEQSDLDASFPFEDLFTGRQFPQEDNRIIMISESAGHPQTLRIQHVFLIETEETVTDETGETSTRIRRRPVPKSALAEWTEEPVGQALLVTKGERSSLINLETSNPRYRSSPLEVGDTLSCSVIPTQFISMDELADEWDKIVFTEHENIVKQALRIIEPELENLTFVKSEEYFRPMREFHRSAKVKMSNLLRPIPLNSLGDGMLRIFQLLLKVFSAKGGFLLIDEFENGLHYSVQEKVWSMLFQLANEYDIQIFATTHSWDCIESFTKVAIARRDVKGVLFRVGKSARKSNWGQVIATVFDDTQLDNITQADVEVR